LKGINQISKRLLNSAVIWFWMLNGLRLASGFLLLPLLLRSLSEADLGMYYVFLNLVALIPVVDASLSLTISRLVGYAMAGAAKLQPIGMVVADQGKAPNQQLLWQLLFGTRAFYRILALGVLLALCIAGTGIVGVRIQETSSPILTWLAWGVTLLSATWEIYSSWSNVFLQGMNQVLLSSRLAVLSYTLRLLIACALLLSGAGLLGVPIASFIASTLQRSLSSRAALKLLGGERPSNVSQNNRSLFAIIWPNSWRVGLKLFSMYFSANAVSFLCLNFFGLAIYGQFGLSLQVMTLIQGMSAVWTWVKWPLIGQLRSRQEIDRIRDLLWPRVWLQALTFIILAALALCAGPPLLAQWGAGKSMLPIGWLLLLVLYAFMEMQFAFWTHLLSTENRIPSLWATVITYSGSVLLTFTLLKLTSLGLGAIVLGPVIAGGLFNYWYWPMAGARSLQTSWLRFIFSKPTMA
jgi:hypothetical protein